MRGASCQGHRVRLFQSGRLVRTWPELLSQPAAAAFVEQYNRLGEREGRTARMEVVAVGDESIAEEKP